MGVTNYFRDEELKKGGPGWVLVHIYFFLSVKTAHTQGVMNNFLHTLRTLAGFGKALSAWFPGAWIFLDAR